MVSMIKTLYRDVDGIISRYHWPSFHQGGFQHPEVCIFDPSTTLENTNFIGGGEEKPCTFLPNKNLSKILLNVVSKIQRVCSKFHHAKNLLIAARK